MARLGSVVGGILKELAQARAMADRQSRELVSEYESDPILSTFNVPRMTLGEINVTLRFTVNDVEQEAPPGKDYSQLAVEWQKNVAPLLVKKTLKRLDLPREVRAEVISVFKVDTTPAQGLSEALAGPSKRAAKFIADELLRQWSKLPAKLRKALGRKTEFRRELISTTHAELEHFLGDKDRLDNLQRLLASNLDIGIRGAELPSETHHIQEITLALRGEDLNMVLTGEDK